MLKATRIFIKKKKTKLKKLRCCHILLHPFFLLFLLLQLFCFLHYNWQQMILHIYVSMTTKQCCIKIKHIWYQRILRISSITETRQKNSFSMKREKDAEVSSTALMQQHSVQWWHRRSMKWHLRTAKAVRFSESSATVSEMVRKWLTAQNSISRTESHHTLRWQQQLQQIEFRSVKMQHKSL